jgi:hypothetical protein
MMERALSTLVLCTALTACSKGGAKKGEGEGSAKPAPAAPAPAAPAPTAPTPTPTAPAPAPTAPAAAPGPLAKLDLAAPELDVRSTSRARASPSSTAACPRGWDVLWVRDAAGKQVLAAHGHRGRPRAP